MKLFLLDFYRVFLIYINEISKLKHFQSQRVIRIFDNLLAGR